MAGLLNWKEPLTLEVQLQGEKIGTQPERIKRTMNERNNSLRIRQQLPAKKRICTEIISISGAVTERVREKNSSKSIPDRHLIGSYSLNCIV